MFASSLCLGQSYQSFESQLEQIRNIRMHIGPFRIYPAFNLKNFGYDSNVYFQPEDEKPVSDYTSTLSPEIMVYFPYRNSLILTFSENPEYVFYAKEKDYRSFSNSFSPGIKYLFLNRFVISGDYLYQKHFDRITNEFERRTNLITKGFNFSFFYETARKTALGFSGKYEKFSNENLSFPDLELLVSQSLNRTEKSGYLEFYYRIFSESVFFLKGGYTEYGFESPEFQWRNAHSYQTYTGIRFPQIGNVRGTFSIGFKKFIPLETGRKSFSGIVGNTNMDIRLALFNFHLEYFRDNFFSSFSETSFFIEDRYGIGVSFYLTKFIRLDYNFNLGKTNYPDPLLYKPLEGGEEEIFRKDTIYTQIPGIVIRIFKNTGIGITLTSWERTSTFPGLDRKRTVVGGFITNNF